MEDCVSGLQKCSFDCEDDRLYVQSLQLPHHQSLASVAECSKARHLLQVPVYPGLLLFSLRYIVNVNIDAKLLHMDWEYVHIYCKQEVFKKSKQESGEIFESTSLVLFPRSCFSITRVMGSIMSTPCFWTRARTRAVTNRRKQIICTSGHTAAGRTVLFTVEEVRVSNWMVKSK